MNRPPDTDLRVPSARLRAFVGAAARAAGMAADQADLLADLLVANDLRGVFSHGTVQMARYARAMVAGKLNPRPRVAVARESPCSALVDGDGGLGYFPAHLAARMAIDKALDHGMAVMSTRNHGHIGAAGLYAQMTTAHDLLCFVTSGHRQHLQAGEPIYRAGGGSPMAFSAPALTADPLLLDFGVMHDLGAGSPDRDRLAAMAPGLVLRTIGLGEICQVWGGLLSGLRLNDPTPYRAWEGAYQGALIVVFRIDLFIEPQDLKAQVDRLADCVRDMAPFPGLDACYLPGAVEMVRQRAYAQQGVPVGDEHRRSLESLGEQLGISPPW